MSSTLWVDFPFRRLALVGMGVSGKALMRLLDVSKFPGTHVTFADKSSSGIDFTDPERLLSDFQPDLLVVSPGYPLSSAWIEAARARGCHVSSELSLAAMFLTQEKVVGVTGSLGKSTVVSLLHAGLQHAGVSSFLGGNIGVPLAQYVSDCLEGVRPPVEWVILELSSFQLENVTGLRMQGAAISYLSSNHLERYASVDEYYATKWQLVRATPGPVVLNSQGGELKDYANRQPEGSRCSWADRSTLGVDTEVLTERKLLGEHNLDNLSVAWTLARQLGWPQEVLSGMLAFPGLPHRVQTVGEFQSIRFINDSKATSLESVLTAALSVAQDLRIKAIESSWTQKPRLVLLLGGRDKKLPWSKIRDLPEKLAGLGVELLPIFFGELVSVLHSELGWLNAVQKPTLREILNEMTPLLRSQSDWVLLSPGGTSLDEFRNFEDRGEFFAKRVRELFDR